MRAPAWMIGSLCVAVWASAAGATPDAGLVEKLGQASLRWTQKTLRASGSGKPGRSKEVAKARLEAERAAQAQAEGRLLKALERLRVDGQQTGAHRMKTPGVRAQLKTIIAGCRPVDTRYFSSGAVDVVLECALDGGLATVLAPPPAVAPLPAGAGEPAFSGLILDARGAKLKPALMPKVYGPDGALLYGAPMVEASALRTRGVAGYATSVEDAKRRPRIGQKPIVLKATRQGAVDLKLKDLGRLGGQNLSFLKEGRLIIVTDPIQD